MDDALGMVHAFLCLVFGLMAGWGFARVLMGHKTAWLPLLLGGSVLVLLLTV